MKHRQTGRLFGRESGERRALMKGLWASLILSEKMTTTEAKAKETKNGIDRLINTAKRAEAGGSARLAAVRRIYQLLPKNAAEKLLMPEFLKRFSSRTSGYVRVVKLEPRKGDGAKMAVIEFV
jgi:large subunit ribosomal protein L17